MKTLKKLFLDELGVRYDAEKQLIEAIPIIAASATSGELKKTMLSHLEQTRNHVTKLETVFEVFGEKAQEKRCQTTVSLLKEGTAIASSFKDSPALNAAIISATLKVEHHEIASYGCLREWASTLKNEEAVKILQTILDEEKSANKALIKVACARSNDEALAKASSKDSVYDNGTFSEQLREILTSQRAVE